MSISTTQIHIVHSVFLAIYFLMDFMYTAFVVFSILYVAYRGFVFDGRQERKSVLIRTLRAAWTINLVFIGIFIYIFGTSIYERQWEGVCASGHAIAIGGFLWIWINCSWQHVDEFPDVDVQ